MGGPAPIRLSWLELVGPVGIVFSLVCQGNICIDKSKYLQINVKEISQGNMAVIGNRIHMLVNFYVCKLGLTKLCFIFISPYKS